MRPKFLITLFILLVLHGPLLCQVEIKGQVSHGDNPVGQASVQVKSEGKLRKAVLTDKKGRFSFFLPFDEIFEVTFDKAGMFPATITVNTTIPKARKGIYDEYLVPFNMKLFYYYAELDMDGLDGPLGEIKFSGEGRESFQFSGNRKVLAAYEKVSKKSQVLYDKGEDPDIYMKDKKTNFRSEGPGEVTAITPESKAEKVTRELRETERKDSAQVAKNISTALRISIAADEEKEELLDAGKSRAEATVYATSKDGNDLYSDKEQKLNALEAKQEELTKQLLASEQKQSAMNDLYGMAYAESRGVRRKAESAPYIRPVEITVSSGWMGKEEKLLVREGHKIVEYKAVENNFLFYRDACYWRNGVKIPSNDYQEVKKLFERPSGNNL